MAVLRQSDTAILLDYATFCGRRSGVSVRPRAEVGFGPYGQSINTLCVGTGVPDGPYVQCRLRGWTVREASPYKPSVDTLYIIERREQAPALKFPPMPCA